jgi:hypothetical protein
MRHENDFANSFPTAGKRICSGEAGPRGEKLLIGSKKLSEKKLADLLRHHDQKTIENKETYQRDDVDQLLDYLSLIEIGFVAGALSVDDVLQPAFVKQNLMVLTDDALRRYYEDHYTLPLPISLKSRLFGAPGYCGQGTEREMSAFAGLLFLKREYEHDPKLNAFLWMLDGGLTHDGNGWTDLLALSRKPTRFMNELIEEINDPTPADESSLGQACLGVRRFLDFAADLAALLGTLEKFPALRLAIWQNYAYWLNDADSPGYRHALRGLLNRFAKWPTNEGEEQAQATVALKYEKAIAAIFDFSYRG